MINFPKYHDKVERTNKQPTLSGKYRKGDDRSSWPEGESRPIVSAVRRSTRQSIIPAYPPTEIKERKVRYTDRCVAFLT